MEIDSIKKNVIYFNYVHLTELTKVITENLVLCMRMGQIISRVKSVERGGGGMEGRTWKSPYLLYPSGKVSYSSQKILRGKIQKKYKLITLQMTSNAALVNWLNI